MVSLSNHEGVPGAIDLSPHRHGRPRTWSGDWPGHPAEPSPSWGEASARVPSDATNSLHHLLDGRVKPGHDVEGMVREW